MPRGKYVNHKGRSRNFNNPEEMKRQLEEDSSSEESSEDIGDDNTPGTSKAKTKKNTEEQSDDESDEGSDDDRDARKGVAGLIEIENPNRKVKKATQKVEGLSIDGEPVEPVLSRREREQMEKQKARIHYNKLHAAGKTSEAKADLARLALVRQQRAEAAAKREAEKKAQTETNSPSAKA